MRDKQQVNRLLSVKSLVDFSLQQHDTIASATIVNNIKTIVSLTEFFRKEASMTYRVYRSDYSHIAIQSIRSFSDILPEHLHFFRSFRQSQVLGNHEIDEAELIYRPIQHQSQRQLSKHREQQEIEVEPFQTM